MDVPDAQENARIIVMVAQVVLGNVKQDVVILVLVPVVPLVIIPAQDNYLVK